MAAPRHDALRDVLVAVLALGSLAIAAVLVAARHRAVGGGSHLRKVAPARRGHTQPVAQPVVIAKHTKSTSEAKTVGQRLGRLSHGRAARYAEGPGAAKKLGERWAAAAHSNSCIVFGLPRQQGKSSGCHPYYEKVQS